MLPNMSILNLLTFGKNLFGRDISFSLSHSMSERVKSCPYRGYKRLLVLIKVVSVALDRQNHN